MKKGEEEHNVEMGLPLTDEQRLKNMRELAGQNAFLTNALGGALDALDALSCILTDLTNGELTLEKFKKDKRRQANWTEACKYWHYGTAVKEKHGRFDSA